MPIRDNMPSQGNVHDEPAMQRSCAMTVTEIQVGQHQLTLIASHIHSDTKKPSETAKLVAVDWQSQDCLWADSKSYNKIKKHYNLKDNDFKFVESNSLSKDIEAQALLLSAMAQFVAYFMGELQAFDLPLDISLGTEFQQQVWRALQDIPYGETISYATLAKEIGNPKGYRAVAQANGRNPFSIIIPCHRVIASDGKLGGYTGGLDNKEYLLAIEGVECRA